MIMSRLRKCCGLFALPLMVIFLFLVNGQVMAIYQIHFASRVGNIELVRHYIKAGDDINSLDQQYGHTPLGYAALGGYLEMAKLLLENGANVKVRNIFGNTPLHVAAKGGKKELAELLLQNGADINSKNKVGYTPLHYAAQNGYLEIVKLFLENKAQTNIKNKEDSTPLTLATQNGHQEIIDLIMKSSGKN